MAAAVFVVCCSGEATGDKMQVGAATDGSNGKCDSTWEAPAGGRSRWRHKCNAFSVNCAGCEFGVPLWIPFSV